MPNIPWARSGLFVVAIDEAMIAKTLMGTLENRTKTVWNRRVFVVTILEKSAIKRILCSSCGSYLLKWCAKIGVGEVPK